MNGEIVIPIGARIGGGIDSVTIERVLSLPSSCKNRVLSLLFSGFGACFHSREWGLTHRE